ncbi:tetratricopeptide repeat protein [Paraferrimonas haliotis]|uniref:Tetratricopeptide repeat-containing protein n=1 Tax=Paraferrimonas haliotis TaxID=2013866 RepID=A0AA37TMR2_9GAMM|nr:tetratricopeptide repeat protein [Paraferrimonas haliotis]GLS83158.1 hypothetical protein GCM10007894_11350 [Paraferrimonas haliotis]
MIIRTLLLIGLLSGCATAPDNAARAPIPFEDSAFFPKLDVANRHQATRLDKAQANDLKLQFNRHGGELLAHQWLAEQLSAQKGHFQYQERVSELPASTYEVRVGNCLSLVLLTAAMAKELGIKVRYREVKVDPIWDRDSGYLLINDHINIGLMPGFMPTTYTTSRDTFVVDFLPTRAIAGYRVNFVTEDQVLSMLFNNLAAENLIDGNIRPAYWMAKEALSYDEHSTQAMNTLALVYRRSGLEEQAEFLYQRALSLNQDDLTSLNNYSVLLADQGRLTEWAAIHKRVELSRLRNPYHFFDQAELAFANNDYQRAIYYYNKALDKADYRHEFYFGLAKSYAQTGDHLKAKDNLAKALSLSQDVDNKKRYQSKLAAFASRQ